MRSKYDYRTAMIRHLSAGTMLGATDSESSTLSQTKKLQLVSRNADDVLTVVCRGWFRIRKFAVWPYD